jgi:MFS family permease
MLPLTAGIVIGSAAGGQLAGRIGRYRPLVLGSLVILLGGFAAIALTLHPATAVSLVSGLMFFIGLGMGPTLPLFTLAIQNSVPFERIGVATAAATFARALGQVMGLGILGSVFAATVGSALAPAAAGEGAAPGAIRALDAAGKLAVTTGVARMYFIGIGVAAVAFVIAWQLPDRPLKGRGPRRPPEPA